MSTVLPPAPYVPPPVPVATDGAVAAEIVKLPPALALALTAIVIKGEVAAVTAEGLVTITTPQGQVEVKLPEPLPARGSTVELTIPPNAQALPKNIPAPVIADTVPTQTSAPTVVVTTTAPTATTQQTPAQQQAAISTVLVNTAPKETLVTPQGLLNFLKTNLQALVKTPVAQTAGAQTTGPHTPTPPAATTQQSILTQRPIQIGQLVRLTALPTGQTISVPTPLQPTLSLTVPITKFLAPVLNTASQPASLQSAAPTLLSVQTQSNAALRILQPLAQPSTTAQTTPIIASPSVQTPGGIITTPLQTSTPITTASAHVQAGPFQAVVSAPLLAHTSNQPQILDVRLNTLIPTVPQNIVQNAGTATLLHGTPTTPVLFAGVIGQTANGLPIIEMPDFAFSADPANKTAPQLMTVQFPARGLAPGTIMRMDVLPGTPQTQSIALQNAAQPWAALDDIIDALPMRGITQTGPQAALMATLPKPGAIPFTAPVLMMAAALRSGDMAAWLGEKGIEGVRSSPRANALARLSADFTSTSKAVTDDTRPAADWRSITLPLAYGQEVHRIQMHYHSFERDGDGANARDKQKGTRFVMDLSLTRMGPMQIDGFSVGRKLDITLRSEQALSPSMRETMRARYHEAVGGVGFAGELNFAAAPDHKGWVAF